VLCPPFERVPSACTLADPHLNLLHARSGESKASVVCGVSPLLPICYVELHGPSVDSVAVLTALGLAIQPRSGVVLPLLRWLGEGLAGSETFSQLSGQEILYFHMACTCRLLN
jgi:hypothetical protein